MSLSAATYILQAQATGDFNADGRDDVALAVDDIEAFPIRTTVLVYLNQGGGAFAEPVEYRLNGLFPQCIEAADVTGDDVLDLVVCHARNNGGTSEGLISVLAGQSSGGTANGTFTATFTGAVGSAPSAATAGDVDADDTVDLLVLDRDQGSVFVLYGSGDSTTFADAIELADVTTPVAAVIDAVPGHPLPQVLVMNRAGRLLTYAQSAPRVFGTPGNERIGLLPATMALADLNDDQIGDLVVLSALGAELWYGEADGGFDFGESVVDDDALDSLTLGDLNGDDKLDIAAAAQGEDQITVILNGADAPGTPTPTATITPTPTHTATPGTPTATPTPPGGAPCTGDCNDNGAVAVNELIIGVNIGLGNTPVLNCAAFDQDGTGTVTVNELIRAVTHALNGCPAT